MSLPNSELFSFKDESIQNSDTKLSHTLTFNLRNVCFDSNLMIFMGKETRLKYNLSNFTTLVSIGLAILASALFGMIEFTFAELIREFNAKAIILLAPWLLLVGVGWRCLIKDEVASSVT
jgi:hypothetical protein